MPVESRFASGERSKAQCPICGLVVLYPSLVKDWRGTWVCPECLDPQHPQEIPPRDVTDAVQLRHPRPLLDIGLTRVKLEGVESAGQLGTIAVTII